MPVPVCWIGVKLTPIPDKLILGANSAIHVESDGMRCLRTFLFCMFLLLSHAVLGQQGTIHIWAGACSICQSSIFNPGWNSDGSGLFMEEMDNGTVYTAAGISANAGDYEVSLVFGLSGSGSVTINPVTDVTLETNSSPHMVLDALEQPDPRISKADVGVQKQFASKSINFNAAGESGGGFLFFPFDSDASIVTVVVHLGGEVFRFPFASIPSVPGKFGNPEHVSTQTSTPLTTTSLPSSSTSPAFRAETSLASTPTSNHPTNQSSGGCAKNISFAVAEGGQIVSRAPQFTQKWIEKNQKRYAGLCFSQTPNNQAMNYVLVFSTSRSSFDGIFPTVKTSTDTNSSPISGSGTITTDSGSMWSYTYEGTETTTTTTTTQENLPYTDTTTSLYVNAYSQNGELVSQRSRAITTRQGGEGANTLGYNLGAALGAIHIKERLLKDAVEDVVK